MRLFIATSTYTAPIDVIEATLGEHVAWVVDGYKSRRTLVSGRQAPPVGGAMVFLAEDPEDAQLICDSDPFVRDGLATYDIVEIVPSEGTRRSPEFSAFLAGR
ncbi:YciI family protein [Pseudarthrobacter sp. NCCP-2145]|uniref:YciI family protein n=1 Tax=Pseudarthrobacter sp. NCCP-2145 TaxID=2942290 RepID=UPI00203BA353|nr:YciI family protein [Pseudarthrobacter sp. NCCP-2145]GKV74806.1 hypothetical protein NCCP2145_41870 [Pseudarthrobacter sp. NCCP-2145]